MDGNQKQKDFQGLEDRMNLILNKSLPASLQQLAGRHENFGEVVQYLEESYIASQRSGTDKIQIEKEAKEYVSKGLVNVLKDIELASLNLDQLIQMQTISIDSVTSDVGLIKSRLHGMKAQHLLTTMDEMKLPYGGGVGSSGQHQHPQQDDVVVPAVSVRRVEVDYLTPPSTSTPTPNTVPNASTQNHNNNNNDDDVALTKDMNDLQVADTEVTNDVVATPIPAARPVSPEEEADVDAEIAPIVPKKLSMQDRMMRVQNIGVSSFNT